LCYKVPLQKDTSTTSTSSTSTGGDDDRLDCYVELQPSIMIVFMSSSKSDLSCVIISVPLQSDTSITSIISTSGEDDGELHCNIEMQACSLVVVQ